MILQSQVVLSELNPILTEGLNHAKVAGFNLEHIGRMPPLSKSRAYPGHIPSPCRDWMAPEILANMKRSTKVWLSLY